MFRAIKTKKIPGRLFKKQINTPDFFGFANIEPYCEPLRINHLGMRTLLHTTFVKLLFLWE